MVHLSKCIDFEHGEVKVDHSSYKRQYLTVAYCLVSPSCVCMWYLQCVYQCMYVGPPVCVPVYVCAPYCVCTSVCMWALLFVYRCMYVGPTVCVLVHVCGPYCVCTSVCMWALQCVYQCMYVGPTVCVPVVSVLLDDRQLAI